ncbi:MAG TPA: sigma 54-interacting transcriptional regulator [Candidatus Limnocylindria bacterium]|nr:sigma 54-interacting transcriptional regulator [Candidatus Limnocylindria bacterium]
MRDAQGDADRPTTLGALAATGYRSVPVREEMRRNLLRLLESGEPLLPGIVGYDDTVVPEVENAILSGHHMVFLGERGQGKSRIIRTLVRLLDPAIPVIAGCQINDDPLQPLCAACRRRAAELGDALPIAWLPRTQRYGEKLATPDVSMADLIGEIDPIRVAEGRYLADEETIHYGLVPRLHRGIFAINELPDLTEKVQVGLFNLMEERDVQIRGYKVRLPVDVVVVATANPEDYTSRGRIVTPLKDRFDVQIRTHYPRTVDDELAIVEQEVSQAPRRGREIRVPFFMKEIIARLTFEARSAQEVNQASGVSVRVSINNYETLLANAEKRAVRRGENEIVPRPSDLHAVVASMAGKIELEYGGEARSEADVVARLLDRAVLAVWDRYLTVDALRPVIDYFEAGWGVEVSDAMAAEEYREGLQQIPGLREAIERLGPFESPGLMAAALEFVLEGLHLHQRLNKDRTGGRGTFHA